MRVEGKQGMWEGRERGKEMMRDRTNIKTRG